MMSTNKRRVLTVGGGSGGHVTPALAVIDELTKTHSDIEVQFWCDRGYRKQAEQILKHATTEVVVKSIVAGKFRRYHHLSRLGHLLDIEIMFKNTRDVLFVAFGFLQSLILLLLWRPNVVFCKGGFVCLPVGYAARLLSIPLVIHDSDAHPGLTNRLLAKHAKLITTGAPLEYYDYPSHKTHYVGIPIRDTFKTVSDEEKSHIKQLFKLPPDKPLVVVTGGGLGAMRINNCMVAIGPELIKRASVVHLCGQSHYEVLKKKLPQDADYKLFPFLSDHMPQLLAGADIVVSRAGGTTMQELAAVSASTIIIPNAQLSGGHQLKNAQVYEEAGAAMIVNETKLKQHPALLLTSITILLDDEELRSSLATNLHQFAKPNAAKEVAEFIERAWG